MDFCSVLYATSEQLCHLQVKSFPWGLWCYVAFTLPMVQLDSAAFGRLWTITAAGVDSSLCHTVSSSNIITAIHLKSFWKRNLQFKHQAQAVPSSFFTELAFERPRAAAEITRTEEFTAGGTNCASTSPSQNNLTPSCGEAWGSSE